MMLTPDQIDGFISDGFVRLDEVVPRTGIEAVQRILWTFARCEPDDPGSWTEPVVRLGEFGHLPFREAANLPLLHAAFDQLVGPGRWTPCDRLGAFVIRFPSDGEAAKPGWHVDTSFDTDRGDFRDGRVNVASRGRALLMLFLFSDVGEDDAPVRLRAGSHQHVARRLAPAGNAGLSLRELGIDGFAETAHCPETLATGRAGTVYLCHPFLVHDVRAHHGRQPRILAQPRLPAREPFRMDTPLFPVGVAIDRALKAA